MATTTVGTGNTRMTNRNRHLLYWIGGIILMAVLVYSLLRPQNRMSNTNTNGVNPPTNNSESYPNTNQTPGTNTQGTEGVNGNGTSPNQ